MRIKMIAIAILFWVLSGCINSPTTTGPGPVSTADSLVFCGSLNDPRSNVGTVIPFQLPDAGVFDSAFVLVNDSIACSRYIEGDTLVPDDLYLLDGNQLRIYTRFNGHYRAVVFYHHAPMVVP